MVKSKKNDNIVSLKEFEERYFPKNKNEMFENIASPYEYGVSLASQAIEKFEVTLHQ